MSEPNWVDSDRVSMLSLSSHWQNWLLDRSSLTRQLIAASHNRFHVEVQRQVWAQPLASERQLLGMRPRQAALVREVVLFGAGQPWVYARSILPAATLTGPYYRLRKLDNRPLGALLFADPAMQCGLRQIARINTEHALVPAALSGGEAVWGRRSMFYLRGKPLLVCEIFLPEFSPYNSPDPKCLKPQ